MHSQTQSPFTARHVSHLEHLLRPPQSLSGEKSHSIFLTSKEDSTACASLRNTFDQLYQSNRRSSQGGSGSGIRKSVRTVPKKSQFKESVPKSPSSSQYVFWGRHGLRPCHLYALTDYFDSKSFNMEYVKKLDAKEIELRKRHLMMLRSKPEYVSKEDIRRLKSLRKELRFKVRECERARQEAIDQNTQYKLLGFASRLEGVETHFDGCFTPVQILAARLCQINKLKRPPNYYDFTDFRPDEGNLAQNELSAKSVEKYGLALRYHERSSVVDFSSKNDLLYPLKGNAEHFFEIDSLLNMFQKFAFYFSPEAFKFGFEHLQTRNAESWSVKDIDPAREVFYLEKLPELLRKGTRVMGTSTPIFLILAVGCSINY